MTLDGAKILVVGGGTRPSAEPDAPPGNGRATAIAAAREGADVALVDIDLAAAEETAGLVRAEGRQAWSLQADVADADACARMVNEAHAAAGGLDGLVLNVGIGLGGGLEHTSAQQWDTVFAVKPSLIRTFELRMPDDVEAPDGVGGPWYALDDLDIVLVAEQAR